MRRDQSREVADVADLPPGPRLTSALAALDIEALEAHELVLVAQAWERQKAYCEAQQLSALGVLAEQQEYQQCSWPQTRDDDDAHVHDPVRACGTEVSLALRVSPTTARDRVALAVDMFESVPAILVAMYWGRLDLTKARVIAQGTRVLTDRAVRWSVVGAAVAKAAELTVGKLRRWVRRAVIAADPDQAERSRRSGVLDRRVSRPEPYAVHGADGLGELVVTGPGEDLVALSTALDAAARAARSAGDERSVEQLRFDVLTGLGWSGLDLGHLGCCNTTCGEGRARRLASGQGRAAAVHVTVAVSTLAGADDQPAELEGFGPVPAASARAVAGFGSLNRLLTDPRDGRVLEFGRTIYAVPQALADLVVARDVTCRLATCAVPARAGDLDHQRPFAAGGTTGERNVWAACRAHHVDKTHHGFQVIMATDARGREHTFWRTPAGHRYPIRVEQVGMVATVTSPDPPDPDPPPF